MDRNKLLRIIEKDLEELNEITKELAAKSQSSSFELDIALSKSKLLFQEFEFLKELHKNQTPEESPKKEAPIPAIEINHPAEEKVQQTEVAPIEQPAQEETIQNDTLINSANKEETPIRTIEIEEPKIPAAEPERIAQKESKEEEEEEEEEEEDTATNKKLIGDSFLKGKSLNDLLSDSNTLDHKLASSPILKLESAIGLNDRFQFIRELFNNDSELFISTVSEIDKMHEIKDAVNFLSTNFKWKKNDTSIKFAQLVKRRFSN